MSCSWPRWLWTSWYGFWQCGGNRAINEESREAESGSASPEASSGEWMAQGMPASSRRGGSIPTLLCLATSCPDTISTLNLRLLAGLTPFQCQSEPFPTSVLHFHRCGNLGSCRARGEKSHSKSVTELDLESSSSKTQYYGSWRTGLLLSSTSNFSYQDEDKLR